TRQVSGDPHALTRPRISIDFHNILVPIFGTAMDDDIVSTAGRMAAEGDPEERNASAVLTILYLIEIPLTRAIGDPLPETEAEAAQRATRRASDVADEYDGVEVRVEIERVRRRGTGIVMAARRL